MAMTTLVELKCGNCGAALPDGLRCSYCKSKFFLDSSGKLSKEEPIQQVLKVISDHIPLPESSYTPPVEWRHHRSRRHYHDNSLMYGIMAQIFVMVSYIVANIDLAAQLGFAASIDAAFPVNVTPIPFHVIGFSFMVFVFVYLSAKISRGFQDW